MARAKTKSPAKTRSKKAAAGKKEVKKVVAHQRQLKEERSAKQKHPPVLRDLMP